MCVKHQLSSTQRLSQETLEPATVPPEDRTLAPLLASRAAAVGIDGLFCEVHPDPNNAKSDGPNSLTFDLLEQLLDEVCAIDAAIRAVRATHERRNA